MCETKTINNFSEISTEWSYIDYAGTLKVRTALGRKSYLVKPGIYKIGNPHTKSEVFVSANYKLSFDILRKNLSGMDSFLLAWVIAERLTPKIEANLVWELIPVASEIL